LFLFLLFPPLLEAVILLIDTKRRLQGLCLCQPDTEWRH
jgi:hypothetical protein